MNSEAKSALSKTIKTLRARLIDDLDAATRRRYRLNLRSRDAGLDEQRASERARLEEWLAEQVRAGEQRGGERGEDDFFDDVIKEAAYTWLNRLVLLRLMEEEELVGPAVVDGGWDSKGYREFRQWAPELMDDDTGGYRLLLDLLFDELAHDLPGLYGDVGLTELVPMPPATLRALVEALNEAELEPCWSDDTTLGWVYQYWNDPEREELDAKINSRGKIEPHEVASKTQLFTERYMVEWLLQNSLNQTWLAICQKNGWTPEVEARGVLDELEERRAAWREKRENGDVELDELMPIHSDVEERWKYWVPQPLPVHGEVAANEVSERSEGSSDSAIQSDDTPESVWDIQLVDPACGSGHFLVIAFDLLWALYQEEARHRGEAFDAEAALDNIFATNLHGIDIDRRAVQIAAAALYLKARTVDEDYRPKTLNLVAPDLTLAGLADDDPALVELRQAVEAETGIPARFVDRILDALGEAHHLGSLLKIDDAVDEAMKVLEPDEQPDLFPAGGEVAERSEADGGVGKPENPDDAPESLPPVGEVAEATAKAEGGTNNSFPAGGEVAEASAEVDGGTKNSFPVGGEVAEASAEVDGGVDTPTTLSESSDVRRTLVDLLEDFLADHSRAEDLGLRLRGQQLANGIRFMRLNREGRYDLVVANPPYLGRKHLRNKKYIKNHYPDGQADLYAAFLERGLQLAGNGGLSAMVTMRNWMFIKTYQDLREHLLGNADMAILGDFDRGAFEGILDEVVAVALPIFRKCKASNLQSVAIQPTPLEDSSRDKNRTPRKRAAVRAHVGRHVFSAQALEGIEGQPLVYWWSEQLLEEYIRTEKVGSVSPARVGLQTGNDSRWIRCPWELAPQNLLVNRIDEVKEEQRPPQNELRSESFWIPFIKGAAGAEWFEPLRYFVNWDRRGLSIYVYEGSYPRNDSYYFEAGVAFAGIGDRFSARLHRFYSIFGHMGSSVFSDDLENITCLLNSHLARDVLSSLNPGIHFEVGDVNRLPLFPIESADEIFDQLDEAFTEHEQARETSVEFKKPGPSCWDYAQDWAQRAVDRPEGEPLPDWEPEYDDVPPENWLSWAIGVALGRFDEAGQEGWLDEAPDDALPHGIMFVSETDGPDSLDHPATDLIEEMWQKHGDQLGDARRKRDDLNSWIRGSFFRRVHRQMYDNAPIYFPLSSEDKTFVAHINIHRWDEHTLRRLLADHLVPEQNRLQGRLADLNKARTSDDDSARRRAEDRYADVKEWLDELTQFIEDVEQCAEKGPPSTGKNCPERETDARYIPDLDDGTMINAAALWPLLDPNWRKYPKKWWKRLANEKGYRGKHFDWSQLAARYFPTRVDQKCQEDPSLAVAHGCFWKYHPARAYEWELRLQDEIHPNFTIDEGFGDDARFLEDDENSDRFRAQFLTDHRDRAEEIRNDEYNRRKRNADGEEDIQPVVAIDDHPTSRDVVPEGDGQNEVSMTNGQHQNSVPAKISQVES